MVRKQTTVINKTGIHARPAGEFVQAAKKYENCEITIANLDTPDRDPVNAKGIFAVLSLGMSQGTRVEITVSGEGEEEAAIALIALIDNGFGE